MYKVIDHLCILYIVTVYIYAWSLNLITVHVLYMFLTYIITSLYIYYIHRCTFEQLRTTLCIYLRILYFYIC